MSKKYIIDTDIGDDIDDALAIALALESKLDIIGITTVYKNTDERARITKRLLSLYGRSDIPVYKGIGEGILGKIKTTDRLCQWSKEIENAEYTPNANSEDAVKFLIDSANNYAEELVIIAIGPLTNIAKAILTNPEAMSKVGRILMMGGDYSRQYCEWNIICDIDAAEIVFTSDCNLVCIGYDVTIRTKLTYEEEQRVLNITGNEYRDYLAQLVRLWRKSRADNITIELHDPLTVYYEIDNELFSMKESDVLLETKGMLTKGMTIDSSVYNRRTKGKEVKFAVDARVKEFNDIFFEKICNKNCF